MRRVGRGSDSEADCERESERQSKIESPRYQANKEAKCEGNAAWIFSDVPLIYLSSGHHSWPPPTVEILTAAVM